MPLTTISVGVGSRSRSLRESKIDRMREAKRQVQTLALHRGAKADAHELELLLVALGDALHHVREVRAGRARLHALLLDAAEIDRQLLLALHDLDARRAQLSEPLAPLMVTPASLIVAVTPWGRSTGLFALLMAGATLGRP